MANLLHLKASRTRVLNSLPTKNFGNDGDIVISRINGKGVYLCTKAGGVWYTANKLSELSKIDKTPLDIIAKKLKIKNIKKSNDSSKFVVSEKNGELRYQNLGQLSDALDIKELSIDYKTSYCSLGQYNNKEECEANNGTWYYSENESHDSISSTAENQLLTIGQSINGLDSESTLLYDGSTLEIKRNSDYDDNWQTSTQDTLLKLSYDSTNNTNIGVNSSGDLTITPSGGDTTLSSSTLTIGTIAEVGSDTDKILMSDSGIVKYVTGANLRSYIGAGTSSVGALNDLSDVTYSSGDLTIASLDTIVSAGCTWDSSGDIILDSTNTANDPSDGLIFKTAGTTFGTLTTHHALSVLTLYEAGGASTADYFDITVDAHAATTINTTDAAAKAAHLTLNPDGNLIALIGDALEATESFHVSITGGNNRMLSVFGEVDNYSTLRLYEMGGQSTADYFEIQVDEEAATTIRTVDGNATAANLILEVDGNLTLDSALDIELNADGGNILFADASVEIAEFASGLSNSFYVYSAGDTDNKCTINVKGNGTTTFSTTDSDGAVGHLELTPNGDMIIDPDGECFIQPSSGGIKIKESADAIADTAAYGQVWVHDDTPNTLWFTNDAGNDIQLTSGTTGYAPVFFDYGGRARTQYNNWYWGYHTAYGINFYYQYYTTSSTSLPSAYPDSYAPGFLMPRNGTITSYSIIGNSSSTDTWEWALMKGAQPTFASAGDWALSQVGATQSAGGTSNILYKWEQTGLSVAVNRLDMILPMFRRTTDNDSSYAYCEFSMTITLE
tara:strand:- start:225 stop:2585 length:2361 start_codon:yes stop_codon:yes gene_type:complete